MKPHVSASRNTIPARIVRGLLAILGISLLGITASAQTTLYWDANTAATAGAGATPTGVWRASGGTATSNRWNTSSTGLGGTISKWTGTEAVFSAGTDAINAYTVTVTGTVNVSSITIEEGTPTFGGTGTITFNDASPDFTVGAGLTTTVSSALAGTNGLNKLGTGTLVFGSTDKAYTGTTTISAGTLDLAFNQSLGTLNLTGGTLKLSSATTTVTSLNVTANSTIDFGGANAALNLTNLTISAGVTLNIINWVAATDAFTATNWLDGGSGAGVHDTTGAAPMNQVVFASFTGNDTSWLTTGNAIRPVPEPATYGAILLSLTTGLMFWRRQRVSHRTG